MTGSDWIAVLVLAAGLALIFALDGLHRLEDKRNDRADRAAADRRLRHEIRRQP